MRVLLAIDGSEHSDAAVEEVASRGWLADTEIVVVTVIHSKWPVVGDPFFTMASARVESLQGQQRQSPAMLQKAIAQIQARAPHLSVVGKTLEGVPHEMIIQEAETWDADLIVLGSRGHGPIRRALLGSVAAAVAVDAPCAVEIVRPGRPSVTAHVKSGSPTVSA